MKLDVLVICIRDRRRLPLEFVLPLKRGIICSGIIALMVIIWQKVVI